MSHCSIKHDNDEDDDGLLNARWVQLKWVAVLLVVVTAAYQITRGGRSTLLMSEGLITIARILYAVCAKVLSVGHPTVED